MKLLDLPWSYALDKGEVLLRRNDDEIALFDYDRDRSCIIEANRKIKKG